MLLHQPAKLKQFMEPGHPALLKQEDSCKAQLDEPAWQPGVSLQLGRGEEHQFPQPYSQVGGITVVVVQTELVVVVDVVVLVLVVDEVVEVVEVVVQVVEEVVVLVDEVVLHVVVVVELDTGGT